MKNPFRPSPLPALRPAGAPHLAEATGRALLLPMGVCPCKKLVVVLSGLYVV